MIGTPDGRPSIKLADFVTSTRFTDLPAHVVHQAKRCLVNYFAVAFAGCHDPTIDKAAGVYLEFSADTRASLIGRGQRTDMLNAAALNAMSANVFDFDDTHAPTIIHPTGPVAAALFALAETQPVSGKDFLTALVLGMEVECRVGNAISPFHYAKGWHITSTCGVFGAAAAIGKVLGLAPQQIVWAFGSAAAQAGGLVECLGTMSKSVSVGNAARNGLLAALLARVDFNGPELPLEGERGFIKVFGDAPNWDALTSELGDVWEINANAFKPYPCGVVLNPVLDACLDLYSDPAFRCREVANIRLIELTGHPLLRQRTDRPHVRTGRLSQVSAQHGVAVALARGKAGLAEFSDEAVNDLSLRPIGEKLRFIDDSTKTVDEAVVRLVFDDGTELSRHVTAARGSVANPLSDAALEEKLSSLLAYSGVVCDRKNLLQQLWGLETLTDAAVLMNTAAGAKPSPI